MSGKTELDILDMDFGDFITPGSNFVNPEPVKEDKDVTPEEEVEELEVDVNELLSKEIEEGSETEEEEEEEIKGPPTSSSSKETNQDDEPFTLVLARYQLEQGVLSNLDEEELLRINNEEGPAAAMTYLIRSEIELNSGQVKSNYDQYSKEYMELRESGYTPEEAGKMIIDLENLDNLDEEALEDENNDSIRRQLLKENYKATTRFSEDKIDRLIKRSFDLGDDVEDAKEALESLKETRKEAIKISKLNKAKQQQEAEEAYKKGLQTLNDSIQSIEAIVPGENLTKAAKDKILKTITTPVKNTEDGIPLNAIWSKRTEDPIKFDATLAYLLQAGVFDGKWDKIMKTAGTRVTSNIQSVLDNTKGTGFLKGGKRTSSGSPEREAAEDMIGPMKNLFK